VEEVIIEEGTDRQGRRNLCDCTMITTVNDDGTKKIQ
jgi:hypothetical protein